MVEPQHDSEITFKLLERLTNEELPESEEEVSLYEDYNKLQELVNNELLNLIEKTSFPRKFEVLEHVHELLRTVRLQMMVPELSDRHIVGLFQPSNAMLTWTWKNLLIKMLPESLLNQSRLNRWLSVAIPSLKQNPLLIGMPTLIIPAGKDVAKSITAISIGDKRIELTEDDYAELLYQDRKKAADKDRMEMSGLTHLIVIGSEFLPDSQCILIVPDNCDNNSKYFNALVNLIDTLVLYDKTANDELSWLNESNVKSISICGDTAKQLVKKLSSPAFTCTAVKDISKLKINESMPRFNNSNHSIVMQSIISEILWYLGIQRHTLNERLKQINTDLLGGQSKLSETVKEIKKEVLAQLEASDDICKGYISLLSNMDDHLKPIADTLSDAKTASAYSDHVLGTDRLLGSLFRLCCFYSETEQNNSQNTIKAIRNLQGICNQHADEHLAKIIVNDYFLYSNAREDLDVLGKYSSREPSIIRLQLRHRKEISLCDEACGKMAKSLPLPRTAEEQRLIGQYLLANGDVEQARNAFYSAMAQGDQDAGSLFVDTEIPQDWKKIESNNVAIASNILKNKALEEAALYGMTRAAYLLGVANFAVWQSKSNDDSLFNSAVKYLNIAAANGSPKGFQALTELWFLNGQRLLQSQNGNADKRVRNSFQNSLSLAPNISEQSRNYNNMGVAAFHLKQYSKAKEYLQKSNSGEAYYLLGHMHEHGEGTAQDRAAALKEYEKAMERGNTQARVDYDRLFAELEAERKAREASERSSYSSSSYYSGYYSYYSGW